MGLFGQTSVYYTTTTTDVNTTGLAVFTGVWLFFYLVMFVVAVVAMWKIFVKAGEEGWKSIIPIYNTIVLLKIVGKPWWWLLLMLVPLVNIVVWLLVAIELGKAFGKDTVFSVVLLFFLSLIGMLVLGFGDAKYVGVGGASGTSAEPSV